MCQAYEAERASIVAGENRATIEGFKAASEGKLESDNPFNWGKYDKEAWDHGWRCWHQKILPYALEGIFLRETNFDYSKTAIVKDRFERKRSLPKILKQALV